MLQFGLYKRTVVVLLFCSCLVSLSQQAQAIDAATLPEFRDDETFKTYLFGVGQGWLWANARLGNKNQPKLFCVPPSLSLNFANYLSFLEAKINSSRAQGKLNEKMPVEVFLLAALEESFPCSQ